MDRLKFWDNSAVVNRLQSSWKDMEWRRKRFLKELRSVLKPGMKVLEIGCGTGLITNWMSHIVGVNNVFGIDYCNAMVNKSRDVNPNISYIQGDMRSLPYKDNSFDLVVIYHVFMNCPEDYEKAISEIERVCKEYILLNEIIALDGEPTQGRLPGSIFQKEKPYWVAYNKDEFISAFKNSKLMKFERLIYKEESSKKGRGHYTIMNFKVEK